MGESLEYNAKRVRRASAPLGHPPRSLFLFKILKPQTGNDARAHYLQHFAMPALVRKRGHRCPRPLFTALRDARASRHGCPRCEFTVLAMPALQITDARAVNSQYLRCPHFKSRMPASNNDIHTLGDSRTGCYSYDVWLWRVPIVVTVDMSAEWDQHEPWIEANAIHVVLDGQSWVERI